MSLVGSQAEGIERFPSRAPWEEGQAAKHRLAMRDGGGPLWGWVSLHITDDHPSRHRQLWQPQYGE